MESNIGVVQFMSRKKIDGRLSVRCGRQTPSPYLKANWEYLVHPDLRTDVISPFGTAMNIVVADLGCGDGRNSKFLLSKLGIPMRLHAFDISPDYGTKCVLGKEWLPVPDESVDIILANYVMMFLSPEELQQFFQQIDRIASKHCRMMVELYAAKDSYTPTAKSLEALKLTITSHFRTDNRWMMPLSSKDRFILVKP